MRTEMARFMLERRADIWHAGDVLQQEMRSRGVELSTLGARIIAIRVCAAFADIPETPPAVQLANLRAALDEMP